MNRVNVGTTAASPCGPQGRRTCEGFRGCVSDARAFSVGLGACERDA
jgi:hypothetical protein